MAYDDLAKLTYTCNAIKVSPCTTSCMRFTSNSARALNNAWQVLHTHRIHVQHAYMRKRARGTQAPGILLMCGLMHVVGIDPVSSPLQEAMRMLPVLADGTNRATTSRCQAGPTPDSQGHHGLGPPQGPLQQPPQLGGPWAVYSPACSLIHASDALADAYAKQ